MLITDTLDFPRDFWPRFGVDRKGQTVYTIEDGDTPQLLEPHPKTQRLLIPYHDHPVVRAYHAIVREVDTGTVEGRKRYLSFIALALPMDDWGILESSAKISASVQELNRMYDLESFIARLDAAERRMGALEGELSDDARSQGDAQARAATGVVTCEVDV